MTDNGAAAVAALRAAGIIAIIRGSFPPDRLLSIAAALRAGGIGAMEVTLNTPGALRAIEQLIQAHGDTLLVGAGTVRTAADAERALDAGARFLVSPNFDPESVAVSRAAGVPHLPGVFTASEAQAAFAAGCRLVKLFPAEALGPSYLRALRAPLDDVDFFPTGGIDAANVADWVRAGAAGVGVGGSLVSGPAQDAEEITARAAQLVAAFRSARGS